jgi:hypothetical protein
LALEEFLVGALFDDLSLLEYADELGVADGGESVGDDEGGASFQEAVHVALDYAFGFAVQGAGRFVEDQDWGFAVERSGDRCHRRGVGRTRDAGFEVAPPAVEALEAGGASAARGRHWAIPAVATFAGGG